MRSGFLYASVAWDSVTLKFRSAKKTTLRGVHLEDPPGDLFLDCYHCGVV